MVSIKLIFQDFVSLIFYRKPSNHSQVEELEIIHGIVKAYGDQVVATVPVRRFVIDRKNVFRSTTELWKLPRNSCGQGPIIVKFTGEVGEEPSADAGGPRREYFTHFLEELKRRSGLFSTGMSLLIPNVPLT